MARAAPPRFARNLAAVLAWELLWGFGAACTSSSIFVPFLSKLEGSKRLVGTVGLTTLLGIPALFVSLWLAHRLRRKRFAVAVLYTAQTCDIRARLDLPGEIKSLNVSNAAAVALYAAAAVLRARS